MSAEMRTALLLFTVAVSQCRAVESPVKLFVDDLYKDVPEAKHFTRLDLVRTEKLPDEYVVVSGDNFTSIISTGEWPPRLLNTWHLPPHENATLKCIEYVKGLNESLLSYRKVSDALRDYICATNHVFLATATKRQELKAMDAVGSRYYGSSYYLIVCFTNARLPYCSKYNRYLGVLLDPDNLMEAEFFEADPRSVSVVDGLFNNYITAKDPLNSTNSYIWTFGSNDYGMLLSVRTGRYHLSGDVEFIGTIPSPSLEPGLENRINWYDYDKGQYIFFNEDAEEDQKCNPGRRFARVARIVTSDIGYPLSPLGGLPDENVFNRSAYSSFQKVRLKCHAKNKWLKFDRLRSVTFDNITKTVFALFTRGNDDGITASAICAYDLNVIYLNFTDGPRTGKKYNYLPQDRTPTAQWKRKSRGDWEMVRPETLLASGATKEEVKQEAERLQQHYLCFYPIEPNGGAALFVKSIWLEHLQAFNYKYYDESLRKTETASVLYTTHVMRLESGEERRHLWKVQYFPSKSKILWPVREELVPVYPTQDKGKKPFNERILKMQLVNEHVPYLLLLTESNVIALKIDLCSQFHGQDECEGPCSVWCRYKEREHVEPYNCPANHQGIRCVSNNSTPRADINKVFEDRQHCHDEPIYFGDRLGMTVEGCVTTVAADGR